MRDKRVVPLIVSVSLDHEIARLGLLRGVETLGDAGGVGCPTGTRSSASLSDRLSRKIASSPNMVTQIGGLRTVLAGHGEEGKEIKLTRDLDHCTTVRNRR